MFLSSSKIFWDSFSEALQGSTWADGSQLCWALVYPEPQLCCNPCRRTLQIGCAFCGVLGRSQNIQNIQRISNLHVITEFPTWEGRWSFPDGMKWMTVINSDINCSVWCHHVILSGCSCGGQASSVVFSFSLLPSLLSPALENYQCGLLTCPDSLFLSTPCCVGWNCTKLFGSDCRWNADQHLMGSRADVWKEESRGTINNWVLFHS